MRRLSISRVLLLIQLLVAQTRVAADFIHEIAGKTKPGIVEIFTSDSSGKLKKALTRFFVSPDGLVVTSQHVIEDASLIMALNNEAVFLFYRLVSHPARTDLALLKFYVPDVSFLRLGKSTSANEGQRVVVIGSATGAVGSVSDSIMSAFRENHSLIQINAPISHVSSESPVMDENGQVTRVATPHRVEGQNLDFSGPLEKVSAEVTEPPSEQAADPEPPSPAMDAEAYFDRGTGLLHKKEYRSAINDFSKVIQLAPNYAAPYFSRGLAYYKLGEFERAINDYNEVIRIDCNNDRAHDHRELASDYYNRGLAYYHQGVFEKAIDDFSEVILLDSNNAHAYYNRGGAYYRQSQFGKAISDYNEAIRLGRDNAETYYNLGLAYSKQRKFDKAISSYSAAIRLNPNHAKAYKNRALAYLRAGKSENAACRSMPIRSLNTCLI
jgi:tetratricopeptide (TPR) repeat protein